MRGYQVLSSILVSVGLVLDGGQLGRRRLDRSAMRRASASPGSDRPAGIAGPASSSAGASPAGP